MTIDILRTILKGITRVSKNIKKDIGEPWLLSPCRESISKLGDLQEKVRTYIKESSRLIPDPRSDSLIYIPFADSSSEEKCRQELIKQLNEIITKTDVITLEEWSAKHASGQDQDEPYVPA